MATAGVILRVAGFRCYTQVWGDLAVAPLLCLHGFLGSHRDWELLARQRGEAGTLAVDLPGHGCTPWPRGLGGEMEGERALSDPFRRIARAVVHELEGLPPVDLLGYSLGGRLALYLALHYPQRFRRVVLESASPGLRTEAERLARRQGDALWEEAIARDFPDFLRQWYDQPLFARLRLAPPSSDGSHPQFPSLWQQRLRNDPQGLVAALQGLGLGAQPSLWEQLPRCEVPLLLIVGEADEKFVRLNQQMLAQCPQAHLAVIPDAGHVVHWEQPQAFGEMVQQFL